MFKFNKSSLAYYYVIGIVLISLYPPVYRCSGAQQKFCVFFGWDFIWELGVVRFPSLNSSNYPYALELNVSYLLVEILILTLIFGALFLKNK